MFEIDAYGLFSKILSQENLTVLVQNDIETAQFDLKHRQLAIPNWHFKNDSFTKMLLAHEVAHAIYTPYEDYKNAVEKVPAEHGRQFHHFINIIEDCRIDKLIQDRYPGLKNTYMLADEFLVKENFFKLNDEQIRNPRKNLSFIDRINVYFKTKYGHDEYDMDFRGEDLDYVDRIEKLRTFEEVTELAFELWEKFKQEQQKTEGLETIEHKESEKGEGNGNGDGEGESQSGDQLKGRVTVEEDQKIDKADDAKEKIGVVGPGIGCTQENLLKNIKEHSGLNVAVSYSHRKDIGTFIVKRVNPNDVINKTWKNEPRGLSSFSSQNVKNVLTEWMPYITSFCTSFERKKNARNFMRTKEEKTGILNPNKLYEYSFNEDIFLSSVVEAHNKNHGFIFLVDCSGSMSDIFPNVTVQLIVLTEIAKRLQIPCRAYGFSDYYKSKFGHQHADNHNFSGRNVSLIELYDERNNPKENMNNFDNLLKGEISLGGTPLGDSLIYMLSVIEEFKKSTRVDVVNFISITDGGDGTGNPFEYLSDSKTSTLMKSDFSTRLTIDNTSAMYRMIRSVTKAKITHVDITDHPTNNVENFNVDGMCAIPEYGGANVCLFIKEKALTPKNKKLVDLFTEALK